MEIDKQASTIIKETAGGTPYNPPKEPAIEKPAPAPKTSETALKTPSPAPEQSVADLEAKLKLVKEQIRQQELKAEIKADLEKLAKFHITDPKEVAARNAEEIGEDEDMDFTPTRIKQLKKKG
jgi:hypothetical protein